MPLIDISKLDPKLTYQANEISTSKTAKILQKLEHYKYPEIEVYNLASHSFALRNKNGIWYIWENHIKGISEYTVTEYEKRNAKTARKRIEINQYDFDLDYMDYKLRFNPGYSVLDLGKITINRLIGLKMPNTPGEVCSESLACCGPKICNILDIKIEYITPADWQQYFKKYAIIK